MTKKIKWENGFTYVDYADECAAFLLLGKAEVLAGKISKPDDSRLPRNTWHAEVFSPNYWAPDCKDPVVMQRTFRSEVEARNFVAKGIAKVWDCS